MLLYVLSLVFIHRCFFPYNSSPPLTSSLLSYSLLSLPLVSLTPLLWHCLSPYSILPCSPSPCTSLSPSLPLSIPVHSSPLPPSWPPCPLWSFLIHLLLWPLFSCPKSILATPSWPLLAAYKSGTQPISFSSSFGLTFSHSESILTTLSCQFSVSHKSGVSAIPVLLVGTDIPLL